MSASDEEEQKTKQVDSEKLLYPPVHPMQTITANMIQPEAGRVYTISGKPLKPRKWTGSSKSLLDRYGCLSCGLPSVIYTILMSDMYGHNG